MYYSGEFAQKVIKPDCSGNPSSAVGLLPATASGEARRIVYGPQLDGCVTIGNASGTLPLQALVEITSDDLPDSCANPPAPDVCRRDRVIHLTGKGITTYSGFSWQ
ncbi:hypothetical protein C3433_23950 [Citrobacter freundii]|nr:hypothetical protein C3433_23950 [Citrobacter freundii]